MFYPRLYENEIPEGDFKKILAKHIGVSDKAIEINPNTRKIIYAGGKRPSDPIDSWNDIDFVKSSGKGLLTPKGEALAKFVQEKNPDLDVKKIMQDVQTNHIKKTNKTYEPIEIPPFPQGMTWGEFWNHQIQTPEFQKDLDTPIKKKTSSKSKKDSAIETDYNIPDNVNQFFSSNKKMNEWNLFLKNVTESSGKSVVGEFNQLFDTMSKVISLHDEGSFADDIVKYKIKKGRIDLDLNSKEAVDSWIDDMTNYIGKYTAEDMINEKVNNDGTYRKIIPPEGTKKFGFLATLMLMEPSGMGRGEVLIAYIVNGAKFAGGGESYDITVDKYGNKLTDKAKPDIEVVDGGKTTTFELKDYSDGKPSIRLGTHGALTRFDWWKEIEKTVKVVREITNELGEERVHEILEDTYKDQQLSYVWDLVASKEPYQNTRIVGSGVDAGEINLGKTATLKVFYSLMHEFFKKEGKGSEDEYDYAVLKGEKVKPVTIEIDSIKKDQLSDIENIKVKASKKDMAKFKELASIKYVQDPLALQRDLDKLGEHYAKASAEGDNKGVDYFMVFVKDKLDVDKLEDFVFDGISQKAAKIISSKRRDAGRGEQYADRAFKEWQKQKDKGYSEIYHDLIIKDKEEQIQRNKEKSRQKSKAKKAKTNESYYPRLFNRS